MSSHREAPEIAKDPAADSTDTYAFVSPDKPGTVTILANYIPLQKPDGGPNFYEFAPDVVYDIRICNTGSGFSDIVYTFNFDTVVRNPESFLYNTGQIKQIDDPNWNRPQYYTLTRTENGKTRTLGTNLTVPPVNVGRRSTPNYAHLAEQAVHTIGGRQVFAGQRADAFHVDLGSVFDLGGLRPFNELHAIPLAKMNGINSVQSYNVHTIGIQVPISELTRNGDQPTDVMSPDSVIAVWSTARRRTSRILDRSKGRYVGHGKLRQVSRLGNPLFNEVIVPMGKKDVWNVQNPAYDSGFAKYVLDPELARLLPVLYPGKTFENLRDYKFPDGRRKPRADLAAILLTGIPEGVIDGFQNYTGGKQADMLRLNVAVPPSKDPDNRGLAYGDKAGFPNGRRIDDDVVTIELRAIAGLTIPLVDKDYTVDGAAKAIEDGTSNTNAPLLDVFPYLGLPGGGYQTKPGTTKAK